MCEVNKEVIKRMSRGVFEKMISSLIVKYPTLTSHIIPIWKYIQH